MISTWYHRMVPEEQRQSGAGSQGLVLTSNDCTGDAACQCHQHLKRTMQGKAFIDDKTMIRLTAAYEVHLQMTQHQLLVHKLHEQVAKDMAQQMSGCG